MQSYKVLKEKNLLLLNDSNRDDSQTKNLRSELSSQEIKKKENKLNKKTFLFMVSTALINGSLYFFVSIEGGKNLKEFMGLDESHSNSVIYGLASGASVCYSMFMFKTLENLTLRPQHPLSWGLAILSPFAASSFFTAGVEGAQFISFSSAAIPIGIALFLLRTINMLDGSVKFPSRIEDVAKDFYFAIKEKNCAEICRLVTTTYTSLGFAISTSDAIYYASKKLLASFGLSSNSYAFTAISATSTTFGVVGTLPLVFYWCHRGLKQLTFGGKPDSEGVIKDPTDIYTAMGAIATIPVMLGGLGSATSAAKEAFGRAGAFASIVRITSSLGYSICGGVPGLSTLFRATLGTCKSALFNAFTKCREHKQPKEEEEILLRMPPTP